MVRISTAANGSLEINAVGGRGAWFCCGAEGLDVAAMTSALSRALRRSIEHHAVVQLRETMRELRTTERRGA